MVLVLLRWQKRNTSQSFKMIGMGVKIGSFCIFPINIYQPPSREGHQIESHRSSSIFGVAIGDGHRRWPRCVALVRSLEAKIVLRSLKALSTALSVLFPTWVFEFWMFCWVFSLVPHVGVCHLWPIGEFAPGHLATSATPASRRPWASSCPAQGPESCVAASRGGPEDARWASAPRAPEGFEQDRLWDFTRAKERDFTGPEDLGSIAALAGHVGDGDLG